MWAPSARATGSQTRTKRYKPALKTHPRFTRIGLSKEPRPASLSAIFFPKGRLKTPIPPTRYGVPVRTVGPHGRSARSVSNAVLPNCLPFLIAIFETAAAA